MATKSDPSATVDPAGAIHDEASDTAGDETTRTHAKVTWSRRIREPRVIAALVVVLALVVGGAVWLLTRSRCSRPSG